MEIKEVAIFAGTFDPFTKGHLALVKEALKRFNKIIILIAVNNKKRPTYSLKLRKKFIKLSTKGIKGIKISATKGLVVRYANKHHINYLLRGVRNKKDYIYEMKMSEVNQKLMPNIKTVIINVPTIYQMISSTEVKRLKKKGEDVSPYVSSKIIKYL